VAADEASRLWPTGNSSLVDSPGFAAG